jgi:hypothetical protein
MQGPYPPCYRYADNLVYLCRGVSEGHRVLERVRRLLEPAGFTLKGVDGVTDLRQGQAQLLGFTLTRRHDRLCFGLGREAWAKLEQNLAAAHKAANPAQTARTVVHGWVNAYGPAFESWREKDLNRVLRTAAKLGFREITPGELRRRSSASWRNWDAYRQRASQADGRGKVCGDQVRVAAPASHLSSRAFFETPEARVPRG